MSGDNAAGRTTARPCGCKIKRIVKPEQPSVTDRAFIAELPVGSARLAD
jgi:hypothetical protein